MNRTIILALLVAVAAAAPDKGWSWGSEEREKEETKAASIEAPIEDQGRSFQSQFAQQSSSIVEIPASDFVNPLPLEPHSAGVVAEVNSAADPSNPNREARFLGISDTLCDWGVGVSCNNKIKKKGHGYAPSINSQYGVPTTQYNNYNTHGSSSYSTDFNNHQHKPKGHKKKGNGGVSDLLSGFLNSYTKPKADKVYSPAKLPTYLPPSAPKGNYGVPVYVAKPVYSPPKYAPPQPSYVAARPSYVAAKPSYVAPRPAYSHPNPTYGAPKPSHHLSHKTSFVDSSYSAPVITPLKPKFVQTPVRVPTVYTHTVAHAPVEATKVQHLHSHTHVYHGAQVIKPGDAGYSSSGFANSNGHLQKKSDSDSNVLSTSADNFGTGSSFVSSATGFSSGSSSFGSAGAASSVNGFIRNPVEASSSSNINQNANPFDSIPSQGFGNGNQGFSTHTKFISSNQNTHGQSHGQSNGQSHGQSQGFQSDRFQPPSQPEFGFKPSLTIEDMINNNQIASQFSRTIYRTDCHCVSEQFCSTDNVVYGHRDLSNVIDARNKQSDVYSNSTSAEETSGENATETESTRRGRSFNLDGLFDNEGTESSTDYPDYETENTETSDFENITTIAPEVSRKKRDIINDTESEEAFSDTQGRQLTGYTPGPQGCGAGTVCCRRPVYNPARALPVCGISNDENIHGRIKTKSQGTGRAGFAEYPWQAAILRRSGGEMVYVCGASLIDDQYLITAAHCVNNLETGSLKVRLGEWDVRDKTEFYPHVESDVSGLYIHPEFYEGNLENDIAIIRVSQRIDYSKFPHISPVCLPQQHADFTGQVCTITGWGKDGWGSEGEFQAILKETDVPIMHTEVCQQVLRTTKLGSTYNLHQGMICAGGEENKDACKGDGGGPLVCQGSSGEYQLAGVVSWGIGCGERGIPGVYVDVPHYIDWINSITRS